MTQGFEDIELQRKVPAVDGPSKKYRIYKDNGEFVIIEAETALEAYRKSGIPNPSRIVKESLTFGSVMAEGTLKNVENPDADETDEIRIRGKLGSDVSGMIETPEVNELPELK